MTPAQWKAVALLSGVFLLGGVVGVGGTVAFVARERAAAHRLDFGRRGDFPIQALTRRLKLTDDQRSKVQAILEGHASSRRAAMQEVMARCGSSVKDEKVKLDADIRAILTPEQQTKFDELSARQQERLFAPHGGRGPVL
jgi:Spy/CpxP family protein refolding chaperone